MMLRKYISLLLLLLFMGARDVKAAEQDPFDLSQAEEAFAYMDDLVKRGIEPKTDPRLKNLLEYQTLASEQSRQLETPISMPNIPILSGSTEWISGKDSKKREEETKAQFNDNMDPQAQLRAGFRKIDEDRDRQSVTDSIYGDEQDDAKYSFGAVTSQLGDILIQPVASELGKDWDHRDLKHTRALQEDDLERETKSFDADEELEPEEEDYGQVLRISSYIKFLRREESYFIFGSFLVHSLTIFHPFVYAVMAIFVIFLYYNTWFWARTLDYKLDYFLNAAIISASLMDTLLVELWPKLQISTYLKRLVFFIVVFFGAVWAVYSTGKVHLTPATFYFPIALFLDLVFLAGVFTLPVRWFIYYMFEHKSAPKRESPLPALTWEGPSKVKKPYKPQLVSPQSDSEKKGLFEIQLKFVSQLIDISKNIIDLSKLEDRTQFFFAHAKVKNLILQVIAYEPNITEQFTHVVENFKKMLLSSPPCPNINAAGTNKRTILNFLWRFHEAVVEEEDSLTHIVDEVLG